MNYKIEILQPAYEFISSLDIKFKAKTFRTIGLLKEFGPFLKEPHSKSIKGEKGLFELRVQLGNNILRLFYFHHKSLLYVITSGFIKKDDKTDKNQITKAMEIMKIYLEQNHENN
ncbi:MAG TPA: type II toxin-antitoxin system RelE/ParE family toxin [Spirochaetota bacterium]|nr:type II toxin-antitoxin system RelE/ParE family toxin [Spirochaetota bacterium]